jgi:hypothetical protein
MAKTVLDEGKAQTEKRKRKKKPSRQLPIQKIDYKPPAHRVENAPALAEICVRIGDPPTNAHNCLPLRVELAQHARANLL